MLLVGYGHMVVGRLVLVKGLSIPEGSRWHGMRLRLQKGDKSKWAENQSGTRFPNLGPSPTGSKTRRHVSPLSRSTFPSLQQPGRQPGDLLDPGRIQSIPPVRCPRRRRREWNWRRIAAGCPDTDPVQYCTCSYCR